MVRVTRGKLPTKKKVVIYGPEGIGKSTFAAQFPTPIIIDTEGSTASMDVARVEPQSWTELLAVVKSIAIGDVDAPCETIVIDTADWAETLCAEHVCRANHWDSISSPGYGVGYRVAWEEYGKLLNALSEACGKGFNVVITAHAAMRKFEQPEEAGSYDRWELKLQNSPKSNICAMVKEWGDMVLFANYKTIVADKDKQGKGKGKGGRRVMYTEHHPCWDAKNRYGLPSEMDFSYECIRGIIEESSIGAAKTQQKPEPEPAKVDMPKTEPKVKLAKRTHYFVTGDKFWKVEKGEPYPTDDALKDARIITQREYDAKMTLNEPEKKTEPEERKLNIDPAIPEKVRRLMEQYQVDEWDIQNVVAAKGYMPPDMPVKDYPSDFVNGWVIPYFADIAKMAAEIREKAEIPYD